MKGLAVLLLLEAFVSSALAYPTGAPSAACSSLIPGHGGSPQSSSSPYSLDLSIFNLHDDGNFYYEPGQTYELTLSGGTFRGFLIQARLLSDGTTLIGAFSDPESGSRLSSCSPPSAGLTHSSNSDKTSISGTWTAPPLGTGPIRFWFAVVQVTSTYWAGLMSDIVYESGTNLIFDGTLRANNSLIIRAQVGMDEDGITCTSDNTSCCDDAQGSGSGWFSPSGEPLHEGLDGATTLYLTRGPGFVRLNRITGGTSALYWCEVPDFNGVIHRFYVGLYTGTLISGSLVSVEVSFELDTELVADPPQFSLTCMSEGGPASDVVWMREGQVIEDDVNHSSSQIVIDTTSALYHNVLVVTGRYGGEYTCTVSNAKNIFSESIEVEVGTEAVNLTAVQKDLSGTSIVITWGLPSSPTPTGIGFTVIYDTAGATNTFSTGFCTECETNLTGLMTGSTYSISIITESLHLPSSAVGPVNVTLATGCVGLGYTNGCCVAGEAESCALDMFGTESDCYCNEQCYSLGNCCPDILLTCAPPADADLCALFRGYECDENAQCLSVGGAVTDSSSYQCFCTDGYIGDGIITCLSDSVVVSSAAVLATNGSSATVTCEAVEFPDSAHHWTIVRDEANETVEFGKILELEQIQYSSAGDRYQCVVETPYQTITSDLVEIVVSPQGGVRVQPQVTDSELGDSATLLCSALGGPRNTISWLRPHSSQQLSSEASLVVAVSGGGDGGVYTCSVTNDAGSGSADATINVAPVVVQSPASTTAVIGSDVVLQCRAEGYPAPTIQWLHYGTVIREMLNITVGEEVANSTSVVSSLEMRGLQARQYGQYQCRASGAVDSETATLSFSGVVSTDDCDESLALSGNVTVTTTGTVCLECPTSDTVQDWLIGGQSVDSYVGVPSVVDGFLVVFVAGQTFSAESATSVSCITANSAYEAFVTREELPPPTVVVIASSSGSIVGQDLNLTCTVTTVDGLVLPPLVEVLDPSGNTLMTGGNVLLGSPVTEGVVTTLEVGLLSLGIADGGRYMCRATISAPGVGDVLSESGIDITLQLPAPQVTVVPPSGGRGAEAGVVYSLMCQVDSNEAYVDTAAEAVVVWRNGEGEPITTNERVTVSETEMVPGGGYRSSLIYRPLSVADRGDYNCSVVVTPDASWPFVAISSAEYDTYFLNVMIPSLPNVALSMNGSGFAGELLKLVCVSQFIQHLLRPPSVVIRDPQGFEVGTAVLEMAGEGVLTSSAVLDPLLTSHGGVWTCWSAYNLSEAGLNNTELYSTTDSLTLTVSIPVPSVTLETRVNMTYIGTLVNLYCTVLLDSAIDTPVQVNTSITPVSSEAANISLAAELGNNTYQSSLVFRPFTSEDGSVYTCNVTVCSDKSYIIGTTSQAVYLLTPIDIPEPTVLISLVEQAAVLGTDGSLMCIATTVPGLLYPPAIVWQGPPPATTTEGELEGEGEIFWRVLHFSPTLEKHGGNYTCSVNLSFPNTTIAPISTSLDYTLIVQAPVPDVVVTQNPVGDVVVESAVSLTCTAITPQPNSLSFSLSFHWTNSSMSPVVSSSRVTIAPTVESRPNEFVSTLSISSLSSELDTAYTCTAEVVVGGMGEFVTSQPASQTLSLTILGPPADFVVATKTQTSMLFSWRLPTTPAAVVGYHLECNTTLAGVSDPQPVSTTNQNATLISLSPGVTYSCTLTAVTASHRPPPATVTATTLESAPSGAPRGLTAVPAGARNITFSWQPPEPELQNGHIVSYTVTCDPPPSSPLPPLAEAGSITLGGLSPFTSYNCSVWAVNSAGSGPPAYVNITTDDDMTLFQVKVLGVGDCVTWKARDEEAKLGDITSAIVDNINKRCECTFTEDSVVSGVFQCFGSNSDSVTFRGGLRGLAGVTSSDLADHVADWVATGQAILLQNVHFVLDTNCRSQVVIDDLLSPECAPPAADKSSGEALGAAGAAGVSIAALLMAIAVVVVALVILYCRRQHSLKTVQVQLRRSAQEKGSAALIHLRASTTSVDSTEMEYNGVYHSTSFSSSKAPRSEKTGAHPGTENPLYSNPAVAGSDMAKARAGAPLPPLPEEAPDAGYAPIIPLNKRGRSISSLPPSDPGYMPVPKRSASESKISRVPHKNVGGSVITNVGRPLLPSLPEEPPPDAGYAPIMPVQMRSHSVTSPPATDYLKPVLSAENTREQLLPPPPPDTVFENRSSGIYEDPDVVAISLSCLALDSGSAD